MNICFMCRTIHIKPFKMWHRKSFAHSDGMIVFVFVVLSNIFQYTTILYLSVSVEYIHENWYCRNICVFFFQITKSNLNLKKNENISDSYQLNDIHLILDMNAEKESINIYANYMKKTNTHTMSKFFQYELFFPAWNSHSIICWLFFLFSFCKHTVWK